VQPGCAADHSPPSSAAVMEEWGYTPTHPLGHTRPVTGSLYLLHFLPGNLNFKCVKLFYLLEKPKWLDQFIVFSPHLKAVFYHNPERERERQRGRGLSFKGTVNLRLYVIVSVTDELILKRKH